MIQIRLLGEQAVVDDAGVRGIRSTRTLMLIGYLAAHIGTPQRRQRVAAAFWPESPDGQALTNLRRELHHLRQELGADPALVVTPTDLCWTVDGGVRVDAGTFVVECDAAHAAAAAGDPDRALGHAATALSMYRGEFLPGNVDEWSVAMRADLERRCVELCDLVCAVRTRARDADLAVDAARRRIELRPLEEVGYRTLMTLQAGAGDRSAALGTYHRCASVLDRELGVAPDPATREVMHRLRRDERAEVAPVGPDTEGLRSGAASPALVGRAAELRLLRHRWDSTVQGRAELVLIRGAAGVGKTRLATEITRAARRQGAVAAASRSFATTERSPLAPVADWLRHPDVAAARVRLDPIWAADADWLTQAGATADPPSAVAGRWDRQRFLEGLARALLGTRRPILLVLDNLQWCDHATLTFVDLLLGLEPTAPVMIVATLRDDQPAGNRPLSEWIARMRPGGPMTEVTLGPLDVAESGSLAVAVAGAPLPDLDVELLHAATGGFPLHIIEAARAAVVEHGTARVPQGDLADVLTSRFGRLGDAAADLARLAAAVGMDFTIDLLTEASDLSPDAVVRGVDELWRQRIVRVLDDGYDFSHDLLREHAYLQISPPQRWLAHRRIAQAIELLTPAGNETVAAQLAEQYERGGRPDRAVTYYRVAARHACGIFAHTEAIELYGRALALIAAQPAGVYRDRLELAVLEGLAGPQNVRDGYSSPGLQATLERSVTLARHVDDPDALFTSLVSLWSSRFVQGRTTDGYRVAQQALAMVDPESDASAPAHFAVGGSAVSLGRPAEALQHLERAVRSASGALTLTVGTRPDVHGTAWSAHAHWLLGDDEQAGRSCADSLQLARTIDHPYSLASALAYGGVTQHLRRNRPAVAAMAAELCELCERHGFAYYRDWGLILLGWAASDGTGFDRAQRGVANLKAAGSFARMPYWLTLLAEVTARDGNAQDCRALLDSAAVTARAHDDVWWLPEVLRLRAAHDDDDRAVSRLTSAARLANSHGSVMLERRCAADLRARNAAH